ncbi:hypothetical protein D1O33_26435 (plasmid) [Rhodococcus rhodochrous]|uniref:nuclear transport factor 2 family protein n=1 Tax=Rhodococcus rhodochrous TaxID=1829 RepID=UPI00132EA04D|nr:nuclear transport factor 2 family protein [Rhodococcus rhodochrous]QHG85531.1 hypothetical protein D1O33_26435 [Rhodococcus rhodochrous]
MSNIDKSHSWIDILARGATEEWNLVVSDDLTMHAPFMPGDAALAYTGKEVNRERVAALWKSWKRFSFSDVEIHAAADDSDLVFVLARSEAETHWGAGYENRYVFRLRFRDGLIVEHLEFLNPLPVIAAFDGHL